MQTPSHYGHEKRAVGFDSYNAKTDHNIAKEDFNRQTMIGIFQETRTHLDESEATDSNVHCKLMTNITYCFC